MLLADALRPALLPIHLVVRPSLEPVALLIQHFASIGDGRETAGTLPAPMI
jgi:hypothetical protein